MFMLFLSLVCALPIHITLFAYSSSSSRQGSGFDGVMVGIVVDWAGFLLAHFFILIHVAFLFIT